MDAYFLALGRFTHMVALLEGDINACIQNLADKSIPSKQPGRAVQVIRALRLTETIEPASKTLKRLVRATKLPPDDEEEVMALLKQLQLISEFRNSVIHNHGMPFSLETIEWFWVANSVHEMDTKNSGPRYFNLQTLDNLSRDLTVISTRLGEVFLPKDLRLFQRPEFAAQRADLYGDWHYLKDDLLKEDPLKHPPQRKPKKPASKKR